MAIATVVVAVATFGLVVITFFYTRTTQKILDTYDKPEIAIYLFPSETFYIFPSETDTDCINLCIENIGTGLASDVKFSGDISFILPISRIPSPIRMANQPRVQPAGIPLEKISMIKNGINYFPPGRKIEIPFFFTSQKGDLLGQSLNLTATYKSSKGECPPKDFNLEFDQWEDYTQSLSTDAIIAASLQKIAENITRFSNGVRGNL